MSSFLNTPRLGICHIDFKRLYVNRSIQPLKSPTYTKGAQTERPEGTKMFEPKQKEYEKEKQQNNKIIYIINRQE